MFPYFVSFSWTRWFWIQISATTTFRAGFRRNTCTAGRTSRIAPSWTRFNFLRQCHNGHHCQFMKWKKKTITIITIFTKNKFKMLSLNLISIFTHRQKWKANTIQGAFWWRIRVVRDQITKTKNSIGIESDAQIAADSNIKWFWMFKCDQFKCFSFEHLKPNEIVDF